MRKAKARQQLRKVKIHTDYLKNALGSCLIEFGDTKVICAVSTDEKVPNWLKGKGQGWLTAEYGMLPSSTHQRMEREASRGKVSGRTQEIQRLIGRSLRAVTDLKKLGERTVWVDADVIQADGGTRTAGITGGYVALALAVKKLMREKKITQNPLSDYIAAISVGIVNGHPCLDLCYTEDSTADVDMNVVMTGKGQFVEVQGTAEQNPFSQRQLDQLLRLAKKGVFQLIAEQKKILQFKF